VAGLASTENPRAGSLRRRRRARGHIDIDRDTATTLDGAATAERAGRDTPEGRAQSSSSRGQGRLVSGMPLPRALVLFGLLTTAASDEGGAATVRVFGTRRPAAPRTTGTGQWTSSAMAHSRRRRRLQPPPPKCPGGTLARCMDACPSQPLSAYKACCAECAKRCGGGPPPPPPGPPSVSLVSLDPASLEVTTLATDSAGDLLNSGSFGTADSESYYTLMQPPHTAGIHLASFTLRPPHTKRIVPLPTTIAEGGMVDGRICGTDEDETGTYCACVEPASGQSAFKTTLGKFAYGGGLTALDAQTKTLFFVGNPQHGGNNFTLFQLDTASGKVKSTTHLHPTPDTQGPAGLVFHPESNKLLAFMPPVAGSWQLVAIEPDSGLISATAGLSGVPPMHGRADGAQFLVNNLLFAAFFEGMGAPCQMVAIDVVCALSSARAGTKSAAEKPPNCTRSISPWPADPGNGTAPMDLAPVLVHPDIKRALPAAAADAAATGAPAGE
jgi:hypothetical protein